jgi:competence protein ComEA
MTMKEFRHAFFGALTAMLVFSGAWLAASPPRGQPVMLLPPPTPRGVVVHVEGAVEYPGLYTLPAGSRIGDAIEAAGGLLADAERGRVNLAALLEDGQQVVIPFISVVSPPVPSASPPGGLAVPTAQMGGARPASPAATPAPPAGGLVNINTASEAELQTVRGIGPAIAGRIVAYRLQNGFYESLEDLLNVQGIATKTLEKLRPFLTVE